MATGKRQCERVPKEDRKNLRGWAEGARETILAAHMDKYLAEKEKGWMQERDYLQVVCREFHARVSWRLQDHEEPTLAPFDPQTMILEKEKLSDEEAVEKRRHITVLDGRIRRWFGYRIRKISKRRRATGDPAKDPLSVLMTKLSGVKIPHKARQPFQQFMNESYQDKIAPAVAEKWEEARKMGTVEADKTKKPKAGFRAGVARKLFSALPAEEQKALGSRATAEAKMQKEVYAKALKDGASKRPEDRQRCIDDMGDFMRPILRGLEEYTGLHYILIGGGPMQVRR
ncbi:hypothetical protein DFH07DRAFT_955774 [Mycena maculata]|uniref:Uncharacterized protein n=1 Tax=Mycena maculata TaxID=230809 RepID=A0AAD7NL61_9AGAR|nr:hypothetical protein DFH07DRAFT_955774 [Mycena maculata]